MRFKIIAMFFLLLFLLCACSFFNRYTGTITEGKINGEWTVNIDIFPMLTFQINIEGDDINNIEGKKIGNVTQYGFVWTGYPGGKFEATEIKAGIIIGEYTITWYIPGTEILEKKIQGAYIMRPGKTLDIEKIVKIVKKIWPLIT